MKIKSKIFNIKRLKIKYFFNIFLILLISSFSLSCSKDKNKQGVKSSLDIDKKIITVTDIAGRTVKIKTPIKSIALSQSRHTYIIVALEKENPFNRISLWSNDLKRNDILTYNQYKEKFPEIDNIKVASKNNKIIDIETTIEKKPDLVIFSLYNKSQIYELKYIEKLNNANIPAVFLDFRYNTLKNTNPSINLLGKIFEKENLAKKIINFRKNAIKKVTDKLKKHKQKKAKIFIEITGGYDPELCCRTFGAKGNFGEFIKIAGGINIASKYILGAWGKLSPEQVIVSNPDKIIITGGFWKKGSPNGTWIPLGAGIRMKEIKNRLKWFYNRTVYRNTTASKNRDIHAIWNYFYNSTYEFVAIQKLAKWFHPELFKDLDPDATFKEFHDKFLPVDYKPCYWSE